MVYNHVYHRHDRHHSLVQFISSIVVDASSSSVAKAAPTQSKSEVISTPLERASKGNFPLMCNAL